MAGEPFQELPRYACSSPRVTYTMVVDGEQIRFVEEMNCVSGSQDGKPLAGGESRTGSANGCP